MEAATTDAKTEQDDWKVAFEHVATFDVPRFIRLFIINRIINTHNNMYNRDTDTLHLLVTGIKDEQSRKIAHKILSLLSKNGIKKYMEKFYSEKKQATVIELIFKNIILKKFSKEYQQLTTYYCKNDNDEYYYQCKVFNNDDLMCLIFRYLTFGVGFIGELHDCSLVNTCWLYHVWSTKLIYGKYNLNYFIKTTMNLDPENDNINNSYSDSVARSWERLVKLKSVSFNSRRFEEECEENNLLRVLSRLSMLNYIEEIKGAFHKVHIALLKVLLHQCGEKINKFLVFIRDDDMTNSSTKYPVISPLYLPNCQIIAMHTLYFYVTWTKKCQQLAIPVGIDENWCKHVIDNCDCSGIVKLVVDGFDTNIPYSDSKESILQQLSKKFVSLKYLKIEVVSVNTASDLALMKLFMPVLKENNGDIHVKTTQYMEYDDFESMNQSIENWIKLNGIQRHPITKLTFEPNSMEKTIPTDQYTTKLIRLCSKNLRWLAVEFDARCSKKSKSNVIKCIVSCLSFNDDSDSKDENDSNNNNNNNNDNDNDNDNDNNSKDSSENDNALFESIEVIDIKSRLMFDKIFIVCEMFATDKLTNIFSENRIFFNVSQEYPSNLNCQVDFSEKESSIAKFKQICAIIKSIMTKQIAANIEIIIQTPENRQRKIYDKIYNSYFGDNDNNNNNNNNGRKVMKQYKQAKCNQYCIALKYPTISLLWKDDFVELRFANAQLKDDTI